MTTTPMTRVAAGNYTRGAIKAAPGGGPITFTVASSGLKRDSMNLRSDGWRLDDYRAAGSPVLWNHEHGRPPIGRAERVYRRGETLKADIVFDPDDEFARLIDSKIRNGFLKSTSVGWDFTDVDGRSLNRRIGSDYLARSAWYNLTEISIVAVGADPNATAEDPNAVELARGVRAWHSRTAVNVRSAQAVLRAFPDPTLEQRASAITRLVIAELSPIRQLELLAEMYPGEYDHPRDSPTGVFIRHPGVGQRY